jgi:hypothetical protein
MDAIQAKNRTFEGLAWGAFFIWWGITELYPSLPSGAWALGFGVIMLGLNAARSLNGLPTSGFTITIGVLAVLWGGLEMAGVFLNLPFELPVFAIVLIVLGVILLARTLAGKEAKKQEA